MTDVVTTLCPVCGELIEIERAFLEMQVECLECAEEFRVVSLDPLELAYAFDLEDEGEFLDDDAYSRR